MPTYDYECQKCGHRFEKFQSISDPPVKTCPECKARKVKRLIGTGAGIIFKGSGFYATDYRSDGYRRAARSDSSGSDSGAKDAAKPAAKAPGKKDGKAGSGKKKGSD
jgi:putative FmdB family regulatory protein